MALLPEAIHVLLVDDEQLSRFVVGNLLRKCNYAGAFVGPRSALWWRTRAAARCSVRAVVCRTPAAMQAAVSNSTAWRWHQPLCSPCPDARS
jgi:CheY-like chemotaxis protein